MGTGDRGRTTPALVAVNLVLLAGAALAAAAWQSQPAGPGASAATRGRGQYGMVTGKTNSSSRDVVYVVDGVNQDMAVLGWDSTRSQLVVVGYRDLRADGLERPGR